MKKAVSLTVLLLILCSAVSLPAMAEDVDAAAGLEGLSFIELKSLNTRTYMEMSNRNRTGDTKLYQIDDSLFVSKEDVVALLGVLTVRAALQESMANKDANVLEGFALKTEEDILTFLVREMLLIAEAQLLGYDREDLTKDLMWYMQEGWLQPEPPAPDASDAMTLIRHGLMRAELWRRQLSSGEDMELLYQESVSMIDALLDVLCVKYDIPYALAPE